jgi:hypothetical protein
MKAQIFSLCVFACTASAFDVDDTLDRLDSTLTVSAFQDNFRARLSGTVDLELIPKSTISSIRVSRFFWTRKRVRNCISSHKRDSIAGSIRAITARTFAWTSMRFELRHGRMVVLHFRPANSRPSSAIGFRDTYHGTIRL